MGDNSLPARHHPDSVVSILSAIKESNTKIEELAHSLHEIMTLKSASTSLPALSAISNEERERAVSATFIGKGHIF